MTKIPSVEKPRCKRLVENGKAVCNCILDCHLHDWRQKDHIIALAQAEAAVVGDWEAELKSRLIGEDGWLIDHPEERCEEIMKYITNLLAAKDREIEEVRQETMRMVIARCRKLVDEPDEAIYLEEIEEMLYELDQEYLTPPTK